MRARRGGLAGLGLAAMLVVWAARAQFVPVAPFGGVVYSGVMFQGALLVGTEAGLYRSDDGGNTFREHSIGMPSGPITGLQDASGVLLACILNQGLYRSTDGGVRWSVSVTGQFLSIFSPLSFERVGERIVARRSGDNVHYSTADTGLTWSAHTVTNSTLYRVCGAGTNLFTWSSTLGASNGLYRSGNLGQSWLHTGIGQTNTMACVRKLGNTVYAFCEHVFASTNDGVSWQQATTAVLTNPLSGSYFFPEWFGTDGTNAYAQNGGNAALLLARWKPGDASWIAQTNGLPSAGNTLALFPQAGRMYLSRQENRYRTEGPGQPWTIAPATGLHAVVIRDIFGITNGLLAVNTNHFLTALETSTVWIATNPAAVNDTFPLTRVARLGTNALLGVRDGFAGLHDFFHSANGGATWLAKYISNLEGESRWLVLSNAVIVHGHDVDTGEIGAEQVAADGTLVTNLNAGLVGLTFDEDFPAMALHGTNLFVVTKGLFNPISSIKRRPLQGTGTVFWATVTNSFNGTNFGATAIASWQGGLYLGLAAGGGVRVSTNDGGSWTPLNGGLTNVTPVRIVPAGRKLLLASDAGLYVFRGGTTRWDNVSFNLPASDIAQVQVSAQQVWVLLRGGGVWKMPLAWLEVPPTLSGLERGPAGAPLALTWASASGLTYRVEAGQLSGGWTPVATGWPAAPTGATSFTNLPASPSNTLFYRVRLE